MKIRALIFDFDGLILETEGPVYKSWQELYQEHNCELSFETWGNIIGMAEAAFDPIDELEVQLGKKFPDRESLVSRRRQRESQLILQQSVLPGVKDYLQAAKRLGLKIGLASSSTSEWVFGHLSRLGLLHYFDCIKTSDDVARAKPDPELYLAVLKELGISPDEAIVFEDSPNGVLAAKAANLYCVMVPNELTRRLNLNHADLRLSSLAELPLEDLLARFEQ